MIDDLVWHQIETRAIESAVAATARPDRAVAAHAAGAYPCLTAHTVLSNLPRLDIPAAIHAIAGEYRADSARDRAESRRAIAAATLPLRNATGPATAPSRVDAPLRTVATVRGSAALDRRECAAIVASCELTVWVAKCAADHCRASADRTPCGAGCRCLACARESARSAMRALALAPRRRASVRATKRLGAAAFGALRACNFTARNAEMAIGITLLAAQLRLLAVT